MVPTRVCKRASIGSGAVIMAGVTIGAGALVGAGAVVTKDVAANTVVVGLAIFYGGLAQFMAGMWSFRRGNTFTATAFTTYGAFWLSLGSYLLLIIFGKVKTEDVTTSLGWFLLGFAIFNTYMLVWSSRVNTAVFGVFLTLEVTEILLWLGFWNGNDTLIKAGGYMGLITAAVAWYTSAADVATAMAGRAILPVGRVIWVEKGARRR